MKKWRSILLVVLAVGLLVGTTIATKRERKSLVYRGQPLKTWSMRAYQGDTNAVAVMKELGTNAIPELTRLLKARDSFFREQTWAHLPKLPPQLRRIIGHKYSPPQASVVREAAARALGGLGTDAKVALPHLARALRDDQGRVRWEAATALSSIGKDSVTVLIKALDEKDVKARHAAADALGRIGPDAAAAVSALVLKLSDPDQSVRNSAAYSLTTVGAAGFLALLDSVEQGREPARTIAARMLTNSYLPHFRVSSEFLKMAQDESPATRKRALEALRSIRVAGGLAVHASVAALHDPVMEVRLAAIETLGARGGAETNVVEALTGCLKDESAQIREEAARALAQLDDQARALPPELTR